MLKSVSVTYRAPKGDSKVTEAFGHIFYDGKAETIEVDDVVLGKLQGNPVFECGPVTDASPKVEPSPKEAKEPK